MAPKNFKPYDDLKTKFYATLNAKTPVASKEDGGDDNDDSPTPTPAPASRPAKPAVDKPKTTASDDDDDFALFRTMIDD